VAVLDIVPHEQVLSNLSASTARGAWHFFFNAVPDLPEVLVQGNVEVFLRALFYPKCHDPAASIEEGIEEYTRAYSAPGALRGGFGYYRAMFEETARWSWRTPVGRLRYRYCVCGETAAAWALPST
jgi:hypothetical protein